MTNQQINQQTDQQIINDFYQENAKNSAAFEEKMQLNRDVISVQQIITLSQFGINSFQHFISLLYIAEMKDVIAEQLELNDEQFSTLLAQLDITEEHKGKYSLPSYTTGFIPKGEK